MKLPIDREWFEKRAAAEGDLEIGGGSHKLTMTLNLTDAEIAALEQVALEALPAWARDRITVMRAALLAIRDADDIHPASSTHDVEQSRHRFRDIARHALAGYAPAPQPNVMGWIKVPEEPTLEFLKSVNADNQVLAYENGRYYNAWFTFEPSEGGWFWTDDADSEPNPSHYMALPAEPALAAEASECAACGGTGRMGPFFPGGLSTICGNCQNPSPSTHVPGQKFINLADGKNYVVVSEVAGIVTYEREDLADRHPPRYLGREEFDMRFQPAPQTHLIVSIADEELAQWAEKRVDDAGRLARELIAYRRGLVSTDVANLVVSAREFWEAHNDMSDESRALDIALEAFAGRVLYGGDANG
jgi:hypothetical protein